MFSLYGVVSCRMIYAIVSLFLLGVLYKLLDVGNLQKIPSAKSFANLAGYQRDAPAINITCTLPPYPKNGRWIVVNGDGKEGDVVSGNVLLEYHCKKGYKLSSKSPYRVCDKNWNRKKFPECLKLCPLIQSTLTTTVKCMDKTGMEIGCHEATEESFLTYTCAPFYEAPFGYKTTFFCSDGDWNSAKPICQPVCGKKVHDDAKPLIYGGKVEKVMEYPWVAIIYQKQNGVYTNICGGSILSQKLVLTAAHCVTNAYGDSLSVENYLVAAGKLHSKYNDSRDPHAQYLNVFRTMVHPTYKGDSRRFLGDIAILITKEPFVLNMFIQPVCFNDVKNINLQVGTIGVVAGFGIKEEDELSDELRTLEIPYKSEATCAKELPTAWGDRYNVLDKLCAGYYNKNMSICRGDSGNGLVFKNPENNRYYVHGVVSLGISNKGRCNVQQNSLYTKVAFHYDFLDRQITKYYIKDCALPPYPDNGIWVADIADKKPGDTVPSDTRLKITCDDGYKLSSNSPYIRCESSFVIPKCQRLCSEVRMPEAVFYNCTSKEGEAINCNEATDYTTLTFECPVDYKIPDGSKNTRQCLNGTWESLALNCQLIEKASENPEEIGPYINVICVYDSKQRDNGVRPEDLNATLCTHIIYDSVGITTDGKLRVKRSDLENTTNNIYRSIADMKKRNAELKVLLSVYGSGTVTTNDFPSVAANPITRLTLIESITNFLGAYGYDGVNVHWWSVLQRDKEYYLTFMRELKDACRKRGWLLSATVYYSPAWLGYEPAELRDIVDWVNLVNYGFYSEWSKYTGQNSAYRPSSRETQYERDNYNFVGSISNWFSIRYKKMSPSIPFFGWYFTLKHPRRHGLRAPITGLTDSNNTGPVNYADICENYKHWTRVWDSEQKSPYKYHENKWLGYDDKDTVRLKAEHAMFNGLFGVTIYPVNGDDVFGKCGPKQVLLKSVYAGLAEPIDKEIEDLFCNCCMSN